MEQDQSLDEVNATFRSQDTLGQEFQEFQEFHLPLDIKKARHEEEHKKSVSTYELPAPYGCRSIATKTCSKVPKTVAKKEPYEKCKKVPSVDCGMVLKEVPELLCFPEVFEDCKDVVQEVPYIDTEEKCEELLFDECNEVTSMAVCNLWGLRTALLYFIPLRLKRKYQLKFVKGKELMRNQYSCPKALYSGRRDLRAEDLSKLVNRRLILYM